MASAQIKEQHVAPVTGPAVVAHTTEVPGDPTGHPASLIQSEPDRPIFGAVAIGVITIVFAVMVGVIYYCSWWNAPPVPSVVLAVEGNDQLEGAAITVLGFDEQLQASLSAANRYTCSFHLQPGKYTIRVKWRDRILEEKPVDLPEYAMRKTVLLSKPKDAPTPSSAKPK